MSGGLARLGGDLWVSGKARKDHTCCISGVLISKGQVAFRPLTNGGNRMVRVHPDAMKPYIIGD